MAEIRVSVDDQFLSELQSKLGLTKSSDLTKEALTLLNWAADEAINGRQIVSASKEGTEVHRLAMPSLSRVSKR